MCANVVTRDNCAVIQLHGRFDFNAHRDVRGAVDRALSIPGAESVTVEMKRVDYLCLLYTSDAADERSSVDLGGRRIIQKKNKKRSEEHLQR